MMLALQITARPDLLLRLEESAFHSIFPEVEAWLRDEGDDDVLRLVMGKPNPGYRSPMDQLVCRVFPWWRHPCRRWYRGNGKALKDLIGKSERTMMARVLLHVLKAAKLHGEP